MGKFLRHLDWRFTRGNSLADHTGDDVDLLRPVFRTEVPSLPWYYEVHALPLESGGIVKALVMFTRHQHNPPPEVLPHAAEDKPGEGIAFVFQHFDLEHYLTLDAKAKPAYLLEEFHAGLIRCATQFQWNKAPLEKAKAHVLANNYCLTLPWKKPLASPDRKLKVQAVIEARPGHATIFLVFSDRKKQELRRVVLCTGSPHGGIGQAELGQLHWDGPRTVKVTQDNGRDYWLCHADGEPEFHLPRAESGDPHGEFHLAQIYLQGGFVPQDAERGMALIRSAAAKGLAHAQEFLRRAEEA